MLFGLLAGALSVLFVAGAAQGLFQQKEADIAGLGRKGIRVVLDRLVPVSGLLRQQSQLKGGKDCSA